MNALVLVAWLLLLGTSGCSESPGFPSNQALVVGLEANPTNLDPRFATDAISFRISQLLFDSLVRLDERSQIVPDLAEGWETPNERTYIFTLRRGVRFHHGRELVAEDVKATFDSAKDPAFKSPHQGSLEKVERIEILDRYQIAFHLKEPFAPFLMSVILGILPKELALDRDADISHRPVGSGPFRLERWQQNERLELVPFDGSFKGRPKLDRIILRVIPDTTVRLLELRKGTLDLLVGSVPPEALPWVARLKGFRILEGESSSFTYLGFNLRDPLLKEKKVREAIAHAVDRQSLVDALLNGQATLATGLLPPWHWAYEPEVPRYPYDPDRARTLLDEAGYPLKGSGPRFTLTYKTTTSDLARVLGEALQEQLRQVGIEVKLQTYEWGTFYADIKSGNFQLYLLSWVGITDPDIYFYAFHSSSFPPRGANRGRYQDPAIDRLLEEGRVTLEKEARRRIYRQIQRIIAKDLPYVSLWHPKNIAVVKEEVRGFKLYPAGDFTPLQRVWLERGR